VHFHWQILDWEIPDEVLDRMGLTLQPEPTPGERQDSIIELTETSRPTVAARGTPTATFKGKKGRDYGAIDAKNQKLGRAGEIAVITRERHLLAKAGRPDLGAKVRDIAEEVGDGAGYDVLSWTPEGKIKHIEVKTTRRGVSTPFYITPNEIAFSEQHPETYYLYRVHDFSPTTGSGRYWVLRGAMSKQLELTPTEFRARLLPKELS
jgi:hypothetical protein